MADSWPFSADLSQGDPMELRALSPVVPSKGARLKMILEDFFFDILQKHRDCIQPKVPSFEEVQVSSYCSRSVKHQTLTAFLISRVVYIWILGWLWFWFWFRRRFWFWCWCGLWSTAA